MKKKSSVLSVREAKAHFSELLEATSQGEEWIILSHGKPKAKLSQASVSGIPFDVDIEWLKSMPFKTTSKPSEKLIREERDGRD